MFKIFIIIVTVFLTSCIAMPVMNNTIPMKEGEERTILSGGIVSFEQEVTDPMPYIYGSIQYNTNFNN